MHAVKVTNAHTESAVEWALLCPISSPTASLAKVDVFNFFIGAKIERSVADTRAHASHFSHPMSAPPASAKKRHTPSSPLRSGKTWLVFHGVLLLALSVSSKGVFMNLSKKELHPYLPLATPIPADYFLDPKHRQLVDGWNGELFSMSVIFFGCAWSFRENEHASAVVAKWSGRGWLAQLIRFWITPFLNNKDCIWKPVWLCFFWVAFGGTWVWSEVFLREKVKETAPEPVSSAFDSWGSFWTTPEKVPSPAKSKFSLLGSGKKKSDKKVK